MTMRSDSLASCSFCSTADLVNETHIIDTWRYSVNCMGEINFYVSITMHYRLVGHLSGKNKQINKMFL